MRHVIRRGILTALTAGSLGASALGTPPAALVVSAAHVGGNHPVAQVFGRIAPAPNQQTLRFYNAPVGYPTYIGAVGFWDTHLHAVDSATVSAARVPYQARFATVSVTKTITDTLPVAGILNLANVRLGLSLAEIAGATPAAVPGQLAGSMISYRAVVPAGVSPQGRSTADLALRATVSGMDARIIFHGPPAAGAVRFSLALTAPHPLVIQEHAGPVLIEQIIPLQRRDGTQYGTNRQVEYVLGLPIVRDSSRDVGAAAFTGPVRMGVSPSAPGSGGGIHADVTLTVDPAWLRDPHRGYPVTLDLPLVTGLAAGDTGFYGTSTGIFGTVSSCAPTVRAPLAPPVVGVQGSCRFQGQVYFDVSPIQRSATIHSAILTVYTPRQMGPTGVRVYPNVAPGAGAIGPPQSWLPPSWNTAPAPITNTPGIPQSSSNGHWQHWDITGLFRQWVSHGYASNGGCTLVGTGVPVFFASPLGTGDDDPTTAPSIQVTFTP